MECAKILCLRLSGRRSVVKFLIPPGLIEVNFIILRKQTEFVHVEYH